MAEHNALRIAGAARRVLDERGGLGVRNPWQRRGRSGRFQARDALESLQDFGLRAEQSGEAPPFRQRDQKPGAGVAQNAGLAAQMLLELREPAGFRSASALAACSGTPFMKGLASPNIARETRPGCILRKVSALCCVTR